MNIMTKGMTMFKRFLLVVMFLFTTQLCDASIMANWGINGTSIEVNSTYVTPAKYHVNLYSKYGDIIYTFKGVVISSVTLDLPKLGRVVGFISIDDN